MTLTIADLVIIIAYFAIVLYVGFVIASRKEKKYGNSPEEYILAGRRLTLPFFIATLVATWYGSILGVGEFVFNSGVVAWVCFGLPYYVAAVLFAIFFAGKIRDANVMTIPDQIRRNYNGTAGVISSIIILFITVPSAYILMLGILIQMFTGFELWISIIIGSIASIAYLFTGGFKADVYTNAIQFVFMYVGFAALLIFSILTLGSISDMTTHLPDKHTTATGTLSWQYIAAWFIIALQTFVDPGFHQRCSAATNSKTARNGILISVVFWAIFDFLTLFTGLYARAYTSPDSALMAFPVLGELVLPPIWKGIFVISMLSAVMSTLDSYAFISATTIGNDILTKFKRLKHIAADKLTKVGLILTSIVGVTVAIAIPSAVEIIYKTASVTVPGLIVPLTLTMIKPLKINSRQAIIIMIFASSVSLIWMIIPGFGIEILSNIEPMFPGIILSVILAIIFLAINKKNHELV